MRSWQSKLRCQNHIHYVSLQRRFSRWNLRSIECFTARYGAAFATGRTYKFNTRVASVDIANRRQNSLGLVMKWKRNNCPYCLIIMHASNYSRPEEIRAGNWSSGIINQVNACVRLHSSFNFMPILCLNPMALGRAPSTQDNLNLSGYCLYGPLRASFTSHSFGDSSLSTLPLIDNSHPTSSACNFHRIISACTFFKVEQIEIGSFEGLVAWQGDEDVQLRLSDSYTLRFPPLLKTMVTKSSHVLIWPYIPPPKSPPVVPISPTRTSTKLARLLSSFCVFPCFLKVQLAYTSLLSEKADV